MFHIAYSNMPQLTFSFILQHLNRELYQQTVNSGAAITAPVKDKAMMALSVTGTKAMRNDSAAQKAVDEAKNGYA
jgi:hypothetical protein